MNAIVKSIPKYTDSISFAELPFSRFMHAMQNKFVLLVLVLTLSIFISAISVVYNQEENRLLFNELSSLQKNRDTMYVTWGQLLLEESTWSTQSRIQKIAVTELNMMMPKQRNIVIVQQ